MFATMEVQYLGHVIPKEGVATNKTKIQCMIDWPIPTNVKGLRGFLGLTRYYRKFIQNYGFHRVPLIGFYLRRINFFGVLRLRQLLLPLRLQ